ncbi:lamin tail domain-containing protein [Verrucomicrobiales bacterium]|nr:lamin tail domain-containing protein [Verrucomicrobiales bacterium]
MNRPSNSINKIFISCLYFFCGISLSFSEIVINEVHYNSEPNNALNEFIELHNISGDSINISGWFFSDGIEYQFPQKTEIGANGYLVIAENPEELLKTYGQEALGPYSGNLGSDGERIELRRSDGTVADTLLYKSRFPWPVGANGTGSSMELINPLLDNDLGGSWRSSSVPGILPELSLIGTGNSDWRWRPGNTEASNPISDWRKTDFIEDTSWANATLPIGYGSVRGIDIATEINGMRNSFTSVFLRNEFHIAPEEIPQQLQIRFMLDDGMIIWINGTEILRYNMNAGELAANGTASRNGQEGSWKEEIIDGVAGYLREGKNTVALQLFNVSSNSSDLGLELEIIRPSRGEGEPPIPSPGAKNSTFTSNAPPITRQVNHWPKQPNSNQETVITAKVTDNEGVKSVRLEYQVVAPGSYVPAFLPRSTSKLISSPNSPREPNPVYHDPENWKSVTMLDNGIGNDETANDSTFTTTVPTQPNRSLLRYRIITEDNDGNSVQLPYKDDPALNFASFVYDGIPDYVVQKSRTFPTPHTYPSELINSIPVYHILTDSKDFDQAVAYNGGDQISRGNYDARSAYNWNCSFVYKGKVYDNVGYRLRQRNARYSGNGRRSFKFRFNIGSYPQFHDTDGKSYSTEWKYLATHKMKGSRGNHTWGIEQAANHILWNMTGTPAPYTHWFHMRVIRGAEEAPKENNGQYQGDYYGMLLAMEEFDVRFLDAHNLKKGNLYKLISGRTDGVSVRRYLAREGVDDGSDFKNIIFQLKPNKSDDWINQHVNYNSWNHYHAIVDAVRHYDVQPNTSEHLKNRAFYFEPSKETNYGRLWVLPWDSDTSWGPNWNGGMGFCKQAIYGTNPPRPEFDLEYRNVVREIRDLIWTEEQINLLLDPLAARISGLVNADRDRWIGASGGSESPPPIENVINDMKKFAFIGGSWVGGNDGNMASISRDSGTSGRSGRDAYLDALGSDSLIPRTPSITYKGIESYPQGGLKFESSDFSDPNGPGSFRAMEWRIAEISKGQTTFMNPGSEWKYLDNGTDQGNSWKEIDYDDSNWSQGKTPAGFGSIQNTQIVTTLDFGSLASEKHPTYYFRKIINIEDPEQFSQFVFNLHVDDAAIVYVNGQEILRDGFSDSDIVNYNTYAPSGGKEGVFDTFEIPANAFSEGTNLIAVELHNQSPGSSDLVFDMSITADASILDPKFEWNANWESGEIKTFSSEIAPPANAVRVGKTYRARVRHMDNTNRWSHWSGPAQFTVTEPDLSPWSNLVISEIMYNPSQPSIAELNAMPELNNNDFEWIEFQNIGPVSIDLEELRFTKGIEFDFSVSSTKEIEPGERLLLVANIAAFNLRYDHPSTPQFVAGIFSKNLSDSGERIKLSFGAGTPVIDFNYDDNSPWPEGADGDGFSLELISPDSNPDHNEAKNWRLSSEIGGSPGEEGAVIEEQTFANWSAENGGVEANSDTDNDGRSALVEFAMGTNPRVFENESNLIKVEFVTEEIEGAVQEALKITFLKQSNIAGVTIVPEWSDDLVKWTTDSQQGGHKIICVMTPIGNRKFKYVYYVIDDGKGAAQVFLRLKATLR